MDPNYLKHLRRFVTSWTLVGGRVQSILLFFCGAEPNFKFEKKCSEYERASRVKAIAQNFNRRR